mmetsp:Transcript_44391/g.83159  ORF Transcript_44391/g.83159 Transcript_44391/m.83159 type:complete len:260 (-) Transcript_44391:21-800(-)
MNQLVSQPMIKVLRCHRDSRSGLRCDNCLFARLSVRCYCRGCLVRLLPCLHFQLCFGCQICLRCGPLPCFLCFCFGLLRSCQLFFGGLLICFHIRMSSKPGSFCSGSCSPGFVSVFRICHHCDYIPLSCLSLLSLYAWLHLFLSFKLGCFIVFCLFLGSLLCSCLKTALLCRRGALSGLLCCGGPLLGNFCCLCLFLSIVLLLQSLQPGGLCLCCFLPGLFQLRFGKTLRLLPFPVGFQNPLLRIPLLGIFCLRSCRFS